MYFLSYIQVGLVQSIDRRTNMEGPGKVRNTFFFQNYNEERGEGVE